MSDRVAAIASFTARATASQVVGASDPLRAGLAFALLAGGADHVVVSFQHGGTNFGLLTLAAGVAQAAAGIAVMIRPMPMLYRAAMVLSLILVQLYLINVTIGLPPIVAHSHVRGTHELWGLTLAWPGPVDAEGLWAKATELTAIACAAILDRRAARSSA